nr:MAG TPA: tail tape measure protein [Caudoviricetes sp.]
MATSVGSAYVSLMPSMDGFASKIGKEFGSQGNAAGKAFGDSMTVGIDGGAKKSSGILTGLGTVAKGVSTAALAGFTALTGAVTAIGGAALSAYADYEQLVGGVDTLFGSASQTLQGYAAEAYKTCGMSANQYMTQATSFAASLVSSCGGDVAKAADYANMAMGDMSDNVNKMGSDMADVQNAYQGFAKQNYTMLDNLKLGYGGTQAEMKRLIADANKLRQEQGKNADLTIDSYADVVEAIHTVQENMGITGTTAKEAATTISGSIGMAKAAWENFITGLGRDDVDFSQLTQQLLESIGAVATNVAPRVAQIGKGIVEAFPVVLSGLGPVLGPVLSEALATAWNIAVGALAELGIQLPTVDASQITGAFQAIADAAASVVGTCKSAFGKLGEQIPGIWDTIVSTIGGAVTTIISAVSPFVTYFASQMLPAIASFASGAVGAFSAVRPVIEQLGSTLLNVGQAILPVLHNAFAMIVPIISQAIGVAMQLFAAVSPLVSQVGAALMPAITSIGTALANLANAVLPILASDMHRVLSVAQMLIPVIQTVLSVVGSIVSVVITVASQVISVVVNAASVVASAIGLVMSLVSGLVSSIAGYFSTMVSTMANAAQQVYAAVTGAFSALVGAVSGHIGSLMNTISSIPGQVMGFFAGAGSWLVGSGRALINGFTQGIQNAIGGALSAVSGAVSQIRSFFPFSPAKRGPFSGHGYTTYSGKALMEGWAEGIGSGTGAVNSAITSALASASSLIGSGITVAPSVAVAGAGAAGTTYNVTVNGGSLNADQRIMQAVDVLVSAAKRSAGSGR